MEKQSIVDMAMGAIKEKVDYEMSKIVDNILDINTKATGKRTLTLTFTLQPDDERKQVQVRNDCAIETGNNQSNRNIFVHHWR